MSEVVLTGQLVCHGQAEQEVVNSLLTEHTRLTLDEPGCLEFSVEQTADPLVFQVDERFADASAFRAHQERCASSEWGRLTAGITRNYTISEAGGM